MQLKLRKIKLSLPISLLLLAGGLGSCVYDTYDDLESGQTRVLKPGNYYVTCDISMLGELGTRASQFENGSEGEHELGSEGNFVVMLKGGIITEVLKLKSAHSHPDLCSKLETTQIESLYVGTFDVEEDYEVPQQCVVILNGAAFEDQLTVGRNAGEILGMTWGSTDPYSIGFNDEGRFVMTNAAYIDKDGKQILAVDVPEDAIQDADDPVDPDKVIHVHVERLVSKFSFNTIYDPERMEGDVTRPGAIYYPEGSDQGVIYFTGFSQNGGIPQFETRPWRVKLTGWGMNALETETFLFKNIDSNTTIEGWDYNDAYSGRSYWSVDPHYDDASVYPWQYRRAVDKVVPSYSEKGSPLLNYCFNDFENASHGSLYQRVVYTPENTYNYGKIKDGLDKRADVLAGTHLIVTGELQVDLDMDNSYSKQDLYRDFGSIIYKDERDCYNVRLATLNYDLQSQFMLKYHWYPWDGAIAGENSTRGELLAMKSDAEYSLYDVNGHELTAEYLTSLNYPLGSKYMLPAEVEKGDGKKIINPENITIVDKFGRPLYVYNYVDLEKEMNDPFSEYKATPIREATVNDIKSLIYEWTGAVDHFSDGKMYYYYPVPMFERGDGTDFCGTVRNSWYVYNLKAVNKIGTSVDDPTEPIVPATVPVNNQLDIQIELIPWHEIDRDITLFP